MFISKHIYIYAFRNYGTLIKYGVLKDQFKKIENKKMINLGRCQKIKNVWLSFKKGTWSEDT